MNAMRSRPKPNQSQSGLAMVETVIVLPLILFLGLAVAEFGHMLMLYNTLNKAQQNGATYIARAAIPPGDTGQVFLDLDPGGNVEQTANIIVYGDIDGSDSGANPAVLKDFVIDDVDITEVMVNGQDGYVKIEISYDFTPIFGGVLSFFGIADGGLNLTFPLQSSITVRVLG